MTPHDKLCAAISILQDHILAADTLGEAEHLLPNRRFTSSSLELAEKMLAELLPAVEGLSDAGANAARP